MSVTVKAYDYSFELWEQGNGKGVENSHNENKFVYRHRVVVRRIVNEGEEEPDKTKTSFTYYGSEWYFQRGKKHLDDNDLISALHHWLREGDYGRYDFREFVKELGLGYEVNESIYWRWVGCKKTLKNVTKLGIDEMDIPLMLTDLQDFIAFLLN